MASDLSVLRPPRSVLLRALALGALLAAVLLALMSLGRPGVGPMERSSFRGGAGYWLLAKDGGVFSYGDAKYYGPNRNQGNDIAGMAATASGNGYWTVDDDGDVFNYGDAVDYGSRPGPEIDDITGFAARAQGDGYWMVAKDGSVSAFGAAGYFGGANTLRLTKPIVGMAATPSGKGYWLIAADGGVFSYGDAGFFGSTGSIRLNRPIVDFGPSPDGHGYRFIGNDGGVFSYGDAGFFGSTGAMKLNQPIVGFAATASGKGYWLVGQDGGVFSFGDAQYYGSTGGLTLKAPIVAIVATPKVKVPPTARDDSASVAEDGSVTIDVASNDTHALPADVSVATTPAHGTVTVSGPNVVYTPSANYNGADSFTYRLTDSAGHSATATVSVTVTAVNDAPVAAASSRSTAEDTAVSSSVSATDVDGDALTYSKVTDPTHGTLTFNANGSFTYTPTANYNGSDTFSFKANDTKANSNTAAVSITVTAVNDAPTISDVGDTSTNEDTATAALGVTVGDIDTGDVLTLSGTSSNTTLVPDASIVLAGSGGGRTVTVTPAANTFGSATITLTVSDGNGGTATDLFVLTVNSVNDAPVAVDGSANTTLLTPVNGTMVATDVDNVGLTYSVVSPPSNGIVVGNPDGTFTYTPLLNFHGPDSFTFRASDGSLISNTATFTIMVNGAPVAVDDSGTTVAGAVTVNVLANDSDPDDLLSSLTVLADVNLTTNGGIVGCVLGNCTYTAAPGFHGQDSFGYTLSDPFGASSNATVTITVP